MTGQLRLPPRAGRATRRASSGASTRAPSSALPGRAAVRPSVGLRDPAAEDEFFASRGMGPEPFGRSFTLAYLRGALGGRSARRSSRSCSTSGASPVWATSTPTRRCSALACTRCARPGAWGRVRRGACTRPCSRRCRPASTTKGSSIESFVDPAGERGSFQEILNVYQRTGEPCRVCGATVRTHRRGRARHALLPALPAAARRHVAGIPPTPRSGHAAALGEGRRLGGSGPVSGRASAQPSAAGAGPSSVGPRLYIVLTRVPRRMTLAVGSLGTVTLERGWYAYVGSAARARGGARRAPPRPREAAALARRPPVHGLPGASAPGSSTALPASASSPARWRRCPARSAVPRRFGAGDCRCAGHLVRFARRPLRRDLAAAAHAAGAPARGAVRAFGRRPAS